MKEIVLLCFAQIYSPLTFAKATRGFFCTCEAAAPKLLPFLLKKCYLSVLQHDLLKPWSLCNWRNLWGYPHITKAREGCDPQPFLKELCLPACTVRNCPLLYCLLYFRILPIFSLKLECSPALPKARSTSLETVGFANYRGNS